MNVAQAAQKVIDFYERHGGTKAWTQGVFSNGENHGIFAPDATCWCLAAAIWKVCEANEFVELRDRIGLYRPPPDPDKDVITNFNDTHSYADVVGLLREIATSEVAQ